MTDRAELKMTKPKSKAKSKVEPSTGNVFADLNLPDAPQLLAKAKLVQRIGQVISERKLDEAEAAALLALDQPKVSALLRGRFESYTIDRLLRFLNALGRDIDIVIRPPRGKKPAALRVLSA